MAPPVALRALPRKTGGPGNGHDVWSMLSVRTDALLDVPQEDDDGTNAKGPTQRATNVRRQVPLVSQPDGVGDAEVSPATRVTRETTARPPCEALPVILVWKSISELGCEPTRSRRQRRVDGVGRPKFDFHTGSNAP